MPIIFEKLRIHPMVTPISNSESTIFLANNCYDLLFNWQFEKKKNVLDQQDVCFLFQTSDKFVKNL